MRLDLLASTVCTSTCRLIMSHRQRVSPRLAEFSKMTIKMSSTTELRGLYLRDDPSIPYSILKHGR